MEQESACFVIVQNQDKKYVTIQSSFTNKGLSKQKGRMRQFDMYPNFYSSMRNSKISSIFAM